MYCAHAVAQLTAHTLPRRGGSLSQNHRRLRRARDRVQKAMKDLIDVVPRWADDAETARLRRFGLHPKHGQHVSSFRHVIQRYQRDTSALLHRALGDEKHELHAAMEQLQSWLNEETAHLKHFEAQLDDMEDGMVRPPSPLPSRVSNPLGAWVTRHVPHRCTAAPHRTRTPCTPTKQRRTCSVR